MSAKPIERVQEIRAHALGVKITECPHCPLARMRERHQREDLARLNGELAAALNDARVRGRRESIFWAALALLALGFAWAVAR